MFNTVTQLTEKHKDDLMTLYRNEFWCNTRKRQDVDKALANSDIVIGLENTEGRLIGFCRELMDLIIEHPRLQDVEHIDLNCLPQMFPFYQQWGFTTDVGQVEFMRRFTKNFAI